MIFQIHIPFYKMLQICNINAEFLRTAFLDLPLLGKTALPDCLSSDVSFLAQVPYTRSTLVRVFWWFFARHSTLALQPNSSTKGMGSFPLDKFTFETPKEVNDSSLNHRKALPVFYLINKLMSSL